MAIAKAGGRVAFYGAAGSDGQWMLNEMEDIGVGQDGLTLIDVRISVVWLISTSINVETRRVRLVELSSSCHRKVKIVSVCKVILFVYMTDIDLRLLVLLGGANTAPKAQSWCDDCLRNAQYTHLLVQNEIPWSSTLHALQTSRSRHLTTFFNPSPMPSKDQLLAFPWEAVSWLVVNLGEAAELFAALSTDKEKAQSKTVWLSDSHDSVLPRTQQLLLSLRDLTSFSSTVSLVCTMGSSGVAVLPSGASQIIHIPAATLKNPVVDTTGAGDCFTGYLVAGFMQHWERSADEEPMTQTQLEGIVRVAVEVSLFRVSW